MPNVPKSGTQACTKYIDIKKVAQSLGKDVSMALLGLHAVTGCDTVSAFAGGGKVSVLKKVSALMKAHLEYQEALKQLVWNGIYHQSC